MPVNVTDVDEFTTPVNYPDDGEDADSGSILECIQDLANRTSWLKKRLWGFGTITNQWISVPLTPVVGSSWAFFEEPYAYRQQQVAAVAVIPFPTVLNSMIIKEIEIRARGRGGHASLPENPPRVEFYRQAAFASAELIASVSDSSGSVGTYEAGDTLDMTIPDDGLNTVQGQAYYLKLRGEYGANAIASGWEVFSISARIQGND